MTATTTRPGAMQKLRSPFAENGMSDGFAATLCFLAWFILTFFVPPIVGAWLDVRVLTMFG